MYIYEKKRIDKNGNKVAYLQLCISYKDTAGKPRRKTILHLGKKGDPKIETKIKNTVINDLKKLQAALVKIKDKEVVKKINLLGWQILLSTNSLDLI